MTDDKKHCQGYGYRVSCTGVGEHRDAVRAQQLRRFVEMHGVEPDVFVQSWGEP